MVAWPDRKGIMLKKKNFEHTSSSCTICAVLVAALRPCAHYLTVHVFRAIWVDVARASAAVGYLGSAHCLSSMYESSFWR